MAPFITKGLARSSRKITKGEPMKQTGPDYNYSQDGTQRWYRRLDGSIDVESVPVGATKTQQQFKDDTDVNIILDRLMKTGEMPKFQSKSGVFGDFTEIGDYQQAMDTVLAADEAFMDLPAPLRKRFDNDPQKLLDFLADPINIDESRKLGLRNEAAPPVVPDAQPGVPPKP